MKTIQIDLTDFGNLLRADSAKLADQELLALDHKLHRAWMHKQGDGELRLADTVLSFDDLVDRHTQVRKEMDRRAFQHRFHDELEGQTLSRLKRTADEKDLKSTQQEPAPPQEPDAEADDYEKGIRQAFGSYGGKRLLAHKIASYLTFHKTYVEPFAGGGAVFFAKDPSPREVLNDRDPEIAFMYRFIRDHAPGDRTALAKRDWVIRKETHERLKTMKPVSDRDRFYKNYYLTRSSYGKMRGENFNPANEGVRIDFPANIERAQKRLYKVTVHNKDYAKVLKKYDGAHTFFYMDPPYPDKYNFRDYGFDEEKFLKALKGLKAKWIVSYPVEHAAVFKGYHVYKVKRRNQMKGPGGNQEWVTEMMASNFPLEPLHLFIDKNLDSGSAGMEDEAPPFLPQLEELELEKVQGAFKSPGGKYRLFKKIISLLPEHKTFVEGFCGGAQVLFHKKPSDQEVMNDINSDLIFAYRFIKAMTPQDLEWLKRQNWVISKRRAEKVFKMQPQTPRERFYRFTYLNKAHYWGRADVQEGVRTGPKGEGCKIQLMRRLPQIQDRLESVKIHSWDWRDVIKGYDSKDTLFYLDPPYPKHWPRELGNHGGKFFKEEDLLPALKKIRGKFILSYELEKAGLFKGFKTYRIKTLWTGARQLGARPTYELLVSNFPLKETGLYVEKSLISNQVDLFTTYPSEEQTYLYVLQHHWRGRNVHADLRFETADKSSLIGWTIADMVAGVVTEPVETLESARKWSKDGSPFKIDFANGRFVEGSDQLQAFPKEQMEHKWLETEGVLDPYPSPGSTPEFQGVMLIEDQGKIEYGAQKDDAHEYFLHGKVNGRLLFRQLSGSAVGDPFWVAMKPADQTPLVLSDREVENKWIPPIGISALPEVLRQQIPTEFRFWKVNSSDRALAMRDALVAALKNGEFQLELGRTDLKQKAPEMLPAIGASQ